MPSLASFVRFLLRYTVVPCIVFVLLLEEFLWNALVPVMRKIGQWPGFRQFETWAPKQNRWVCLGLFLAPDLLIIPVKILSLKLLASGHGILAVALFLAMKVIGTAVYAWIYKLTEQKLIQFDWIRIVRDWIVGKLALAKAWIHRQPLYVSAKSGLVALRASIAAYRSKAMASPPSWLRRFIVRVARRKRAQR